jgi:hypothetical protein
MGEGFEQIDWPVHTMDRAGFVLHVMLGAAPRALRLIAAIRRHFPTRSCLRLLAEFAAQQVRLLFDDAVMRRSKKTPSSTCCSIISSLTANKCCRILSSRACF